ncbi:hypothetical protein NMG60_11035446 [Bertholletia excelsa]
MKALNTASIAHKKLNIEVVKKRKTDASIKGERATKKPFGAPKRPPSAFFVFMEEFRKTFRENFPDNKSVSAVGKAGGERWMAMSESEKAPFVAKAAKKKVDYEKAKEEFNRKLNGNARRLRNLPNHRLRSMMRLSKKGAPSGCRDDLEFVVQGGILYE